MSEEIFLKSLKIVCDEITKNKTTVSSTDFNNVKIYIKNNPTDYNVKLFKSCLINILQTPFLDNSFIQAINIPDEQKYRKKQEIIKNFPLKWEEYQYRLYFYNLISIDNYVDFWIDCINFFKDEGNCNIPENIINEFIDFKNNNMLTIKSNKDNYLSYENELGLYKQALSGQLSEDFNNFKNNIINKETFSNYELSKQYEYKKIGNIGETYIFKKIEHMPHATFTAREIGNGFGFDMYYQMYDNNKIIENLIEVKSTTNLNGNDFIELSDNEYNVMINTQNEPNIEYYICRVFIDINKNEPEYYFLKLNENTLKDINNNIEYEVDENNNHLFKRKQKVLNKR